MEKLTSKIDRYLSNKLSDEEKTAFEREMENDDSIQEEVNLQLKTIDLLERSAYLSLKDKVASLDQPKSDSNIVKMILRVAAVLVVIIVPSYFYIHSNYTDQNLYAAYEAPYPDRITSMGGGTDAEVVAAMEFYNKELYEESALALKKIRIADPTNAQILLYESVSLMNTDRADQAIDLLSEGIILFPNYDATFQWYLILAYLADEQGEEAIQLVKEFLKHNEGYQEEKANALLKDLESIWR